ncbi:MAG: DUF6524 family protein [Myxococcota bacterium]
MIGLLARFVAVLVLVLTTWNPEGRSYVHWVGDWQGSVEPTQAFAGVVLTICWVAVFLTAWRSLGVIPTGLLAALVGTGLWMVTDWADAQLSARAISYLVLVSIAFVLASAMSWKQLRGALTRRRDT